MLSNVWQGWQDFAPMVAEELLTWSLQVAGLLGAVWVVTALLLRKQTGLRSALWLTALLLIPLLPLVARVSPVPTASLAQTIGVLRKSTPAEELPSAMPEPTVARVGSAPSSPEPTAAVPPTTVTSAVQPEPTPTELAALEGPPTFWSDSHFWTAAAVLAWWLGALVMLARLVLGARWVRRLLRRAEPVSDPSLLKAFEETQRQIAVARPVQLRTSALVSVPMTVGVFHPVIIVPRSALDVSRRQPLEHALCHELAHVKRWDAATTLYRRVLEAVLFFHPLVWLANRRYQLEQEHICDDWAVAALGSRRQYARSLAELAEQAAHAAPVAALSFGHRPSVIRRRVTRVLEGKGTLAPRLGLRGLSAVVLLALALLLLGTTVTLRTPAVDVNGAVASLGDREEEPSTPREGSELIERQYDLTGTKFPKNERGKQLAVELLKTFTAYDVPPSAWERGRIEQRGTTLTVVNTEGIHRQVADIVEGLRKYKDQGVVLEFTVVWADPAWRKKFPTLAPGRFVRPSKRGAEPGPPRTDDLMPGEVPAFPPHPERLELLPTLADLEKLTSWKGARHDAMPIKTPLLNGAKFYFAILVSRKVDVPPTREGEEPEVVTVQSGLTFLGRPLVVQREGKEVVRLSFRAEYTAPVGPTATAADGSFLEVPAVVSVNSLEAVIDVPDGWGFRLSLGLLPEGDPLRKEKGQRELLIFGKIRVEPLKEAPAETVRVLELGGRTQVATPAVSAYEEALRKKVSVNIERSPDGNRLTVQYAVIAICNAAGIPYQWDKSRRLTQGQCTRYIGPVRLRNVEAQKAIADILSPVGLAFSLDSNGLYLHKPTSTGEPPLGPEADEYEEALKRKVSVNIDRSPDGDRLTVQYAVIAICKAAGVPYQWDKSRRLADAQAARYIGPVRLRNVEAQKAIADIVSPVGLTFSVDQKGVYLHTALREMVLKHDDGTMEGKRSLAGSGHFVQFDCPPGKWHLTEVHIFGSRYGTPMPPRGEWTITLCDSQFKTVRFIRKPYSLFQRGAERWYKIPVPPLELPSKPVSADRPSVSPDRRYVQMDLRPSGEEGGGTYVFSAPVPFWINVAFNPHQTKGVYLGYDSSDQECFSKAGLPDQKPTEIPEKYDWMIRLVVTQDPPKRVSPNLGAWREPRKPLPPWQEEGLVELKNDDGESDGKLSMGGRGPAIRFENVPEGATLTRLRMYALRYGSGFDPETTYADYYLFDTEGRILQTGQIPYALFAYQEKWVDIPLKPVKVPGTFWVLINPEADRFKGIYTHYDTDVEAAHSKSGRVPEELSDLREKWDWMIRAYIRSDAHSSTPGSGAGAGGELTERRYDLSGTIFATLAARPLWRRPDQGAVELPAKGPADVVETGIANLLVDEAETGIVRLINMVTGEKVWEVGRISQEGSTLTVANTAEVHGQVAEVLDTLRAHPNLVVQVEVRFVGADPAWRQKVPALLHSTGGPGPRAPATGPTASRLTAQQEEALLDFADTGDSWISSVFPVRLLNGQLTYVAIGRTKLLSTDGAAPPQPVWSGKLLEFCPFVQKGLKNIRLWVNAADSQVQEVERARADGTVEKVAKVATSQLVTTLAGPDGSTFLISLGPMEQEAEEGGEGREPRELLVVVKTKVLLEDEAEVNPPGPMKP